AELEARMGEPNFWDNPEAAQKTVAELKIVKAQIDPVLSLLAEIDDVRAMYELANEAGDNDLLAEADQTLSTLEKKGERVELQALLDGPNDARNCFLQIHAGA